MIFPKQVYVFRGILGYLLVAIILTFSFWWIIGGTLEQKLTRTGIIFETLGLISVAPELIGKEKTALLQKKLNEFISSIKNSQKEVDKYLNVQEFDMKGLLEIFLNPSEILFTITAIGNFAVCTLLIARWFIFENNQVTLHWLPSESFTIPLMGILAFTWIDLFLLILGFMTLSKEPPAILGAFFLTVHLIISILSVTFTLALANFLKWLSFRIDYLHRLSFSQILAWITIPFVLLGNILQFLGTFY